MKTLLWHLGLGDAIICAPIAVALAKEHGALTVPCWRRNLTSVKIIFIEDPEIEVFPIDSEAELPYASPDAIRLGQYNPKEYRLPGENFDAWFFRQAGMDIIKDQMFCPIRKMFDTPKYREIINAHSTEAPFRFIHEDPSREFVIDRSGFAPDLDHVLPRDKKKRSFCG